MARSTLFSYIGRAVGNLIRKYDANWFVRFLKIAREEDARQGLGVPEPLKSHAWLATAIDFRADNLARAEWKIYPANGDEEITTGPVYKLFRDVNFQLSRRQLFRATESWLAYKGEAFWIFDLLNREDRSMTLPKEIYVVDPRKMTHRIGTDGRISMWTYDTGDEEIPFTADEVIHFAYWNPWDQYRGISRIAALSHEIASDVEANRSNLALLRNGSVPQGLLASEQMVNKDQALEMRERWEHEHRGASRAHAVAVLGQGMTYTPIQLTPADMEYDQLKRWDRGTILARLGVPGVLIGAVDERTPLSGSDTKHQMRIFWDMALMPELDLITDKLRTEFFTRFRLDLVGEFDTSGISELNEDEDLLHTRVRADVAGGIITQNEARETLGYDPVPGGDVLYTQLSWLPMGETREPVMLAAPAQTVKVRAELVDMLPKAVTVESLPVQKVRPVYTEAWKTAHWKAVVGGWEVIEREYEKALKGWMYRQRSLILETLAKSVVGQETKAVNEDFRQSVLDESYWQTEAEELREFSEEYFRRTALLSGSQVASLFRDLGLSMPVNWTIFDTRAVELIETRLTKIGGLVDTIRSHLDDTIGTAIRDGLSERDAADLIRNQYQYNASRAATIARTEIGNVLSDSRMESYKSLGVQTTEWLTARDDRVRDSHKIDGEVAAIGERFSNGLTQPNEEGAPADEVINCRCLAVPVTEE